MSREWIEIGPTPCDESCSNSFEECERFVAVLENLFHFLPHAKFEAKWNAHDFAGGYYDVRVYADEKYMDELLFVEGNTPETWEMAQDKNHSILLQQKWEIIRNRVVTDYYEIEYDDIPYIEWRKLNISYSKYDETIKFPNTYENRKLLHKFALEHLWFPVEESEYGYWICVEDTLDFFGEYSIHQQIPEGYIGIVKTTFEVIEELANLI